MPVAGIPLLPLGELESEPPRARSGNALAQRSIAAARPSQVMRRCWSGASSHAGVTRAALECSRVDSRSAA